MNSTASVMIDSTVPLALTQELVLAIAAGAKALRSDANQLSISPIVKTDTVAGRMVRQGLEQNLQRSALLDDWCIRHAPLVGLDPDTII
jgi:hypothetical protein